MQSAQRSFILLVGLIILTYSLLALSLSLTVCLYLLLCHLYPPCFFFFFFFFSSYIHFNDIFLCGFSFSSFSFFFLVLVWQSDGDNREDILKVFRLFDDYDSGSITLNDLVRVSRELGETMNQAELKEMIERADLDGDGVISPEEFINIMTKKTFD